MAYIFYFIQFILYSLFMFNLLVLRQFDTVCLPEDFGKNVKCFYPKVALDMNYINE